jgi:hypothetical protein
MIAMDHTPGDTHRMAEESAGAAQVSSRDRPPNRTAAHFESVDFDGPHNLHLEAALASKATQQLRTTESLVPERDAVADDDFLHSPAGDQKLAYEVLRRDLRERRGEPLNDDRIDLGLGDALDPSAQPCDQRGGPLRREHGNGMRLECQDDGGATPRSRTADEASQDFPMAAMYAVEIAQGQHRRRRRGTDLPKMAEEMHRLGLPAPPNAGSSVAKRLQL